jgi:Tfp pilus assembly protein PilZ
MKDSKTEVAILGSFSQDAMAAIGDAAAEVDAPLRLVARTSELRGVLVRSGARVVIVDGSADAARDACDAIRGEDQTERVAFLAMTRARTDVAFLEMYQWGVDDLVDVDARSLARRLRAIDVTARVATGATRPFVVIAGLEPRWRALAARALSNAGIDTCVAGHANEAFVRSKGAAFVFAQDDLEPSGVVAALTAARSGGSQVPWVISAPPKRFAEIAAAVRHIEHVACIDAFTPAENVIFVGNELARAVPTDKRAEPRMMFGTTVSFRVAGRDVDEVGFLYNVSSGGMYVRTLAPPEAGEEVWLDLRPPRCDRRVRLLGKVAWKRAFGPADVATAPPGFGVHVEGGLGDDLRRLKSGVAALRASILGEPAPARTTHPPETGVIPSILSPAIV